MKRLVALFAVALASCGGSASAPKTPGGAASSADAPSPKAPASADAPADSKTDTSPPADTSPPKPKAPTIELATVAELKAGIKRGDLTTVQGSIKVNDPWDAAAAKAEKRLGKATYSIDGKLHWSVLEKKKCVVLSMEGANGKVSLVGTQDFDLNTTSTLSGGVKYDPCTGVMKE